MAQNYDLIEIVATGSSGCCPASEYVNDFIAKTNGTFIGSLGSTDTSWSPYNFSLGTTGSSTKSTLTVAGNTTGNAEINVTGAGSNAYIKPHEIVCAKFRTFSSQIKLENAGSVITSLTFNGDILPGTDNFYDVGSSGAKIKKIWTTDADVSGTLSAAVFNPSTLSVSGTSSFTGIATFGDVAVNGTATVATLTNTTGTITTLNSTNATLGSAIMTSASVSTAPTQNNDVLRWQDVHIPTGPTLSSALYNIEVTNGFITGVALAIGSDLPTHVGRHQSTSLTGTAPVGTGDDSLHAYEVGAVARDLPVVKGKLKITSNNDYTYSSAQDYFIVLESNQEPAASGPEGQIIFRKAPQ